MLRTFPQSDCSPVLYTGGAGGYAGLLQVGADIRGLVLSVALNFYSAVFSQGEILKKGIRECNLTCRVIIDTMQQQGSSSCMLLHCLQDMKANRLDDNSTRTVPHTYARGHTRTHSLPFIGLLCCVVWQTAAVLWLAGCAAAGVEGAVSGSALGHK